MTSGKRRSALLAAVDSGNTPGSTASNTLSSGRHKGQDIDAVAEGSMVLAVGARDALTDAKSVGEIPRTHSVQVSD